MPLQTALSIFLLALILYLLSVLLVWGVASIVRRIPEPVQTEGAQAGTPPATGAIIQMGSLESIPPAPPAMPPPVGIPIQAPPSRRALTVLCPRTGVVHSLSVAMGERVEFGQELCVLETGGQMTAIRAGHTGIIARILVAESDPVKSGDTIMEFSAYGD
ncbi:MAG: acetyl-CoA carboxylase biotin carboxyl carrier protein subunit [Anaerolineaceae bacterium]|nr:acetyl-CoA carboxylase biotin carboxyl carrier protein subunit [Anaerolineaceae bacterium]